MIYYFYFILIYYFYFIIPYFSISYDAVCIIFNYSKLRQPT